MNELNALTEAMSDDKIATLREEYKDNPSVVTLLDGILETRGKEAEQAKAKAKFEAGIAKLFGNLPHPEDVHNIYVRWAEVDVPIPEAESVDFAILGEGKVKLANDLTEDELKHDYPIESRVPIAKEYRWVVDINKGIQVARGNGGGSPTASKRAVTVFKRDGTTLELKGHYQSASKACEALKLTIGGDSATRVLARDGFIVEPYEGTEFSS